MGSFCLLRLSSVVPWSGSQNWKTAFHYLACTTWLLAWALRTRQSKFWLGKVHSEARKTKDFIVTEITFRGRHIMFSVHAFTRAFCMFCVRRLLNVDEERKVELWNFCCCFWKQTSNDRSYSSTALTKNKALLATRNCVFVCSQLEKELDLNHFCIYHSPHSHFKYFLKKMPRGRSVVRNILLYNFGFVVRKEVPEWYGP